MRVSLVLLALPSLASLAVACAKPYPDTIPRDEITDWPTVPSDQLAARLAEHSALPVPSDLHKHDLASRGVAQLSTTFRLCVSADGKRTRIDVVAPSGHPEVDSDFQRAMETWRFAAGPADACSQLVIDYHQR